MDKNTYCVIMAGGIGSRFWPMSTVEKPKQFLDILGTGKSLLRQTYDRFCTICPPGNIYVVTNKNYRELVSSQLPEIGNQQILCEPMRKNTAPCIVYASYKISLVNPEANIVVTPSDHLILKEKEFIETIQTGLSIAEKRDCLITLGIKPTRPDTGYGYIQFDEREKSSGNKKVKKVKTFTEKPDKAMAEQFLESGDFYWNSGIFIWSLQSIMSASEQHLPKTTSYFKSGLEKFNTSEEEAAIEDIYSRCKNLSIDYGVMEKANNVYVVLSDFGWSDLGTWVSLYEHSKKDGNQNAVIGSQINLFDSKNCIVNLQDGKTAIINGLDGYIVVEANNTLLICPIKEEQKIKDMLNEVSEKKQE